MSESHLPLPNSGHRKAPLLAGMPMKIGVMGGAGQDIPRGYLERAHGLGRAIARAGCVLITGACPGLPLAAAGGAKQQGGMVVGISPGLSAEEHIFKYESPAEWHDVLIFTGSGLMGREVVNIRSSDIVVIVGGSSGTLGELAIAYDEGKLIGVLTGTGGISEIANSIIEACNKQTGARVVYEPDPDVLLERLLTVYDTEHYRHPSCFGSEYSVDTESTPIFRTARDLVCGMWIDPDSASCERSHEGHRYVFCSNACAERFASDPRMYLLG